MKIYHNKLSIAIIEIQNQDQQSSLYNVFSSTSQVCTYLTEQKQNTQDTVSLLVAYKDAQQTGTEGTSNCIGYDVFIFFFNNPLLICFGTGFTRDSFEKPNFVKNRFSIFCGLLLNPGRTVFSLELHQDKVKVKLAPK